MVVPPPHNLTLAANTSGVVDFIVTVNDGLMYGLYGTLLLITIFILTYLTYFAITNHAGKSMMASSFIVFILAIFLRIVGILPDQVLYACLALCAFSVAMLRTED